jgi:UDP-N-acetylmuramoyl-L-alanyl-D-glutamate--2,6-diaminopimelate ligase
LRFQVAVLTNLSRDHLDYHGSLDAYAAAKAQLFAMPGLTHAVLNHDDAFGRQLQASLPSPVQAISYSLSPDARGADLVCQQLRSHAGGLELRLHTPAGPAELSLPLLGSFNAANALATLGALLALELPLAQALQRLQRLRPVPGRMQRLGGKGLPQVVIDYAHTPAALTAALKAVRQHSQGRVWCVFGCGGERDVGKRAEMGAVADSMADVIVITDDNPRNEDPRAIFAGILAGVQRQQPFPIHDRAAAIRLALERAEAADTILIAGKGHEDYQLIGGQRLAFDDAAVAKAILQERATWTE